MIRVIVGAVLIAILTGCRTAGGEPLPAPSITSLEAPMAFSLQSSAFAPGAAIPRQNTCDGADQSPPLVWSGTPAGAQSLALIVEDPDAPGGTFIHWVIFNLPPAPSELPAGVSKTTDLTSGARQGRNDFRRVGYGGPCPPRGPAHHYHFLLFALDQLLNVTPGASAAELRAAMQGHVLAQTELIGTYGR
jgi:Raf kinase inhibitor-like YbhB/YbcL family protein